MKAVEIDGSTGISNILIGERLANLSTYIPESDVVIITDSNVRKCYETEFPTYEVIEIGMGEEIKNLDTAKDIYQKLLDLEATRSTFIVGIGGGVVCDIAGFISSTYLRGIRFGFVASTLLSQVDASIGGKNGVNFNGYKNVVGVFNQPEFVICDMALLTTLPEKQLLSGFGEVIKHAAINDPDLFSYLEENYEKALAIDPDTIENIVSECIRIKSAVVSKDEKEKGERRKLNFGHTLGHAVEKETGIFHGEAISIGMVAASKLSVEMGMLPTEQMIRLRDLIERYRLPSTIPIDRDVILNAMKLDKKRESEQINFVLLKEIGNAVVEKISIKQLEAVVKHLD